MKKKALISLTLSLASWPVFAQSHSTIFGVIDMYAGSTKGRTAGVNTQDKTVKQLGTGGMTTSHMGFKGREDLGAGAFAAFELSGFFRANTGQMGRSDGTANLAADPFFSRSSWVGLGRADLGSIRLGNANTPLFLNSITSNAFGASTTFSPLNLVTSIGGPLSGGTAWANQVFYESPSLGGFNAMVNYGFSQGRAGHNVGGRLAYATGPLRLGFAIQDVKRSPITFADGTALAPTRSWQFSMAYDFGSASIFGHVGAIEDRGRSGSAGSKRHNIWELSAAVNLGRGKVLAGIASRSTNDLVAALPEDAPGGNVGREVVSLGYNYPLSRRTDLYTILMHDRTKTRIIGAPTNVTANATNYGFGIRHRF